jgi:type III pantothenate kinase
MLLVIDTGKPNIVIGLFRDYALVESWRVHTSREQTSDEYGILFRSLLDHAGISSEQVDDVIMSSVVPPLSGVLESMCKRYFGRQPLSVGPGLKTGMPILYDNPKDVGADRIVNAVAAYETYQSAGIIVDFGTATTFDAISAQGQYMGGAIAPGIGIGAEALFQRASKLPRVEVTEPPNVIGRNTVHSIQAGLFFGYVGLVDEVVTRMKAEIGGLSDGIFVMATGGRAPMFAVQSRTIDSVASGLTLEGLRILYERNRRK